VAAHGALADRSSAQARKICRQCSNAEVSVMNGQNREEFDTALTRIRHDIKGRLVKHGFFGMVSFRDIESADHVLQGSTMTVTAKGRIAERSFGRQEIEGCTLRVSGAVALGVIAMVDELSTPALEPGRL
jgi:hypothetical protein